MGRRLTTTELAKELGLSAYAITSMRKQGLLPYIKVDQGRGRIYYDIDLINKALDRIATNNAEKQGKIYNDYMKNKYAETSYLGVLA